MVRSSTKRSRYGRAVVATSLGLLVGLLGCQGPRSEWSTTGTSSSLMPPARVAQGDVKEELPPADTARLCLTAGQEADRAGRAPEAIAYYVKARQIDPAHRGVCRRLGVLFDRVGEFGHANREYQEALKLTPRDASLHNDLGYSCYCQGRFADAEKHLRRALELDPKAERPWVNLGLTLAAQERYGDSLNAFKKIVPEAQAHANLAFVQATQGKRGEAAESYRSALRLDGGLTLARGALAKLEQAPTPTAPNQVIVARPPATIAPPTAATEPTNPGTVALIQFEEELPSGHGVGHSPTVLPAEHQSEAGPTQEP